MPARAFSDQRLKASHFRVLGAICRPVIRGTGCARISQKTISKSASIAVQKVGGITKRLEEFGLIKAIKRGRTAAARFRCNLYQILYDPLDESPATQDFTCGGEADQITTGGESAASPPEVIESDSSKSDLPSFSERSSADSQDTTDAHGPRERRPAQQEDSRRSFGHTSKFLEIPKQQRSAISDSASAIRTAKEQADDWEAQQWREAETRFSKAFFKKYPGHLAREALEALTTKVYEKAIHIEKRNPGRGIRYAIQSIRNAAQSRNRK